MEDNNINEKLLEVQSKMLKALQENSLQSLIDTTSQIFASPVVVTNPHYQRLGISPEKKVGDDVYDQLVDSGEMKRELLRKFLDTYLIGQERNYKAFYVREKPPNGVNLFIPRIFTIIRDRNNLYAHMGILIKEEDFKDWHLQAADLVSDFFLAYYNINVDQIEIDWRHRYNNFLQIISPSSSRKKSLDSYKYLERNLARPWRLLLVNVGESIDLETYSRVIIRGLRKNYPNILFIIHGDYLYCLEENSKNTIRLKEVSDYMDKQGYSFKVYFGKDLGKTYLENSAWLADLLLEYVKKSNKDRPKTYRIKEELNEIASHLFLKNKKAHLFIHPAIREVRSYDKRNGTEYYKTLNSYCENGLDKARTSQDLHIHRNTLLYRFNRIKDLFGLDINDNKSLHNILLSLWILK